MTLDQFNAFCGAMPHAHHVVQWGGAHVWKVATKVFAFADVVDGGRLHVTFKVSELSYDILKTEAGCRPAPYLASRGLKWIQRTSAKSMSDKALRDYLGESYRLAALNLPKKVQRELGLIGAADSQNSLHPRKTE